MEGEQQADAEYGGETPQTARRSPHEGRQIFVQEFPGGDMDIEVGRFDDAKGLYLNSDEARAVRQALKELEQRKEDDDDGQ